MSDAHIVWRDESVRTAAGVLLRAARAATDTAVIAIAIAIAFDFMLALCCVVLRCVGAVRACVRRACVRASAGICEGWENIGDHDLG